jgi:hypothetical protein
VDNQRVAARQYYIWWAIFPLVLFCVASCNRADPSSATALSPSILVSAAPLSAVTACRGAFVSRTLNHITTTGSTVVSLYESNGAGVAINDLDDDGDLDVVLANLHPPNTILWNEGSLHFRTQHLSHGDSRGVAIVDVDGDGRQDIVFTRRFAKPMLWRNTGAASGERFVAQELPGVYNPFYSMNWGDLDGDGDLDLVAGSYDTELRKQQGAIFDYRGGGVGVFIYTRHGDGYRDQRLADEADALTIGLFDLNDDNRLDILVGNDFKRRDYLWLNRPSGWQVEEIFAATSENTMSLDMGDVDNDGIDELFATDMKPYEQDTATLAAWLPMMAKMEHPSSSSDPQITENVLQVRGPTGRFRNQAYARLVDATGWSWSSKFGDLDNDGFLDIYVVNGMIADSLFAHLPGNQLIEENRALRNNGRGHFELAPTWGLDSTASGRGMSMADLDDDGDLDIVVNNLGSPTQLFENQLCGGAGFTVDLRWPASQNPFALGARLTLYTERGVYHRTVRAASGYLSGDPARSHFGLPPGETPQALEIQWPDQTRSRIDHLTASSRVTVVRQP